jgi:peptidoglycan/LPS O-acetylase OafA/YrhL
VKSLRRSFPYLLALPIVLRLIESLLGVDIITMHIGTFTHCDGLIMGSAIAVYVRTAQTQLRVSNRTAIITALFIACVFVRASFGRFPMTFTLTNWNILQRTILFTVISAGYSWYLYLCIGSPNSVQRFFESRSLRWMGRYSYGIYVLHEPIVVLLGRIPLPASVVASTAEYPWILDVGYIIEKHFLKLKRYFEYSDRIAAMSPQSEPSPASA